MRSILARVLFVSLLVCAAVSTAHGSTSARADWGNLPLHFEPNRGQIGSDWEFVTRGPGYALLLESGRLVVHLHRERLLDPDTSLAERRSAESVRAAVGLRLLDAHAEAKMEGAQSLEGKVNYYRGQDPSSWIEGVPTFGRVETKDVYPGIDLVYYGNAGRVEFDFVVGADVDPSQIALGVEGTENLRLTGEGALELISEVGPVVLAAPIAYQQGSEGRRVIEVAYDLSDAGTVRFRLGDYDSTLPLVIDPVLIYSTFLGGSSGEWGTDIAVDGSGNAIVVGRTDSLTDFPILGAAQAACAPSPTLITSGCTDAFVTKLNAAGTGLVYSTYLGGAEAAVASTTGADYAWGVDVDPAGNAYVTGQTESFDFPATSGAFQTFCRALPIPVGGSPGGRCLPEVFVAKLSSLGVLNWATYVGGTNIDIGFDIAVNSLGNAYVTGLTYSLADAGVNGSFGFPTQVAWNATCLGGDALPPWEQDCHDAFYLKLSQDGSSLVQSSYLGGSGDDAGYGIAVNDSGDAVITGHTQSTNFLTTSGALNGTCLPAPPFFPCSDGFVTRIQQSGIAGCTPVAGDSCPGNASNSGGYSTYLGGVDASGQDVVIDDGEAVYIGGVVGGSIPTTAGAYDVTRNNIDAFVMKIAPGGTSLEYSTYVGGVGDDAAYGIAVDFQGRAYIAGRTDPDLDLGTITWVNDFPTLDAFQATCGSDVNGCTRDFFVTKLNAVGSALDYSSYLGGSDYDGWSVTGSLTGARTGGIDVDPDGNAYVTGTTSSTNFPTTVGAYDRTLGILDAFITKVETTTCFPSPEVCDGEDNDCDGVVDNGIDDLESGTDVGECRLEIQSCIDGSFEVVQTGIGPTSETCDGLDNDCQGQIDNGIPDQSSGSDVGECQPEIQSCVGGIFQVTQPGVGPAAEVCDGLDNDCDGQDDVTQGICNSPPGPDPVEFTDPSGSASLEFPDIAVGGETTVAEVACSLDLPEGFTLNAQARCFDIQSTAESSTGEMIICLRFPNSLVPAPTHLMKCEEPANAQSCCYTRLDGGGTTCLPDAAPPGPQFLSLSPAPAPPPDELEICVTATSLSTVFLPTIDPAQDSDFDLVLDLDDNCPLVFNPSQTDEDEDGNGDLCDNCLAAQNGPLGGTCTAGDPLLLGLGCTLTADCGVGGACSKSQEDFDTDDVGDACDPNLVPFFADDVFETPDCFFQGGCTPSDFPVNWGVVRTFHYGVPTDMTTYDVLIEGTWGDAAFGGTAPVEVYLEGVLVAECVSGDPCWDNASNVDWNGGAGFLLSDLGVSFADPAVRTLFDDGAADLSLIQNDAVSANFSNLKTTVYLPEPHGLFGLASGCLALFGWSRRRDRSAKRSIRRSES